MIGENIRALRKEKGITQEQLSEVMGLSVAAVSKWETGQCAPELTALTALADFFEVSVDTLLDHELPADRREYLVEQMNRACMESRSDQAAQTAELLLRRYPNDPESVDAAASLYYRLHMLTEDKAHLRRCIELTKRLFVLDKDPTGKKRFELMGMLGNQYGLLKEWDTAEKYYRDSNVGGVNDSALAGILVNRERYEEAAVALSDLITRQVFDLLTTLLSLQTCRKELEQTEEAADALRWGLAILDHCDSSLRRKYSLLGTTYAMLLACLTEESYSMVDADAAIQTAIRYSEGCPEDNPRTFLHVTDSPELLHSVENNRETLVQWLEVSGSSRLVKMVKETMAK